MKNKHLEELDILGYTLIENVLTAEDLQTIAQQLQEIWKVQEQEVEGVFDIVNSPENNIVRAPLAYHEIFAKAYNNPVVITLLKEVLGDYFILSQENGVIVEPNLTHSQNKWHRDFPHMHFVSTQPLAINAFFCITDFTFETGATQVLPHSHKIDYEPSPEYMEKHSVNIQAKAGSVFLFNTMLYHRTGKNISGKKRIGLNHIYSKYILKQQIDIPSLFDYQEPEDSFLKMLLGFDSKVPTSTFDYRIARKQSLANRNKK